MAGHLALACRCLIAVVFGVSRAGAVTVSVLVIRLDDLVEVFTG
ncbi:hypothetical protein SAMN05444920_1011080 [Nonomuraea solani]|uniref:Uncharacterized protein n=1 Tax=Nonomuraea solani TaxID=1144553 RepID=A0A1H5W5N3_9ACTN|nr:hypothetical protein [Nonomuraea solani]SEF94461.1 hypothetical protein SAMN05444920_1011080 [Nonomuraea solani]